MSGQPALRPFDREADSTDAIRFFFALAERRWERRPAVSWRAPRRPKTRRRTAEPHPPQPWLCRSGGVARRAGVEQRRFPAGNPPATLYGETPELGAGG